MRSVQEEAARWFARLRDAGPDHPERGRFEAWLASDPVHAAEYAAIEDVWNDFGSRARLDRLAGAIERAAADSDHRQGRRRALKRGILGLFLCTGASAAALSGWRYWQALPLSRMQAHTGINEIGRQALPDGSLMTLGAATRVEVRYFRDLRLVNLIAGDAIFDVVKDPERPFVVDGGLARVTVVGTRFAVSRVADRTRISVESGRVKVEDAAGRSLLLDPGQVAEVQAGAPLRHVLANAADGFAWQRGTIVFDNASLQEIAATLSRYRHLPVRAPVQGEQRITAVVQSADIDQFLGTLPTIFSVRIDDIGGETRITPR